MKITYSTIRNYLAGMAFLSLGLNLFAQPALDWAFSSGTYPTIGGYTTIERIATSPTGDLIVGGNFSDEPLHPDPANSSQSITPYGYTSFLVKYDTDGNYQWSFPFYFTSLHNYQNSFSDIQTDDQGNVYVMGEFYRQFDADPGPATVLVSPAPSSTSNMFLIKYSANGAYQWHYSLQSPAGKFDIGPNGNLFICGGGNVASIDFDPGVSVVNGNSFGSDDAYIVELDNTGAFVDLITFGGTAAEDVADIVLDGSGNIYIMGNYRETSSVQYAQFDPLGSGVQYNTFAINNCYNGYLLKLNSNGAFQWVQDFPTAAASSFFGAYGINPSYLQLNSQNEIVMATAYSGSLIMDPTSGTPTPSGQWAFCLSSFDNVGNPLYYKEFPGTTGIRQFGIRSNDQIVLALDFTGTFDIDPGTNTVNYTSGNYSTLLAAFDANMNLEWSYKLPEFAQPSLALNAYDDIHIASYNGNSPGTLVDVDLSTNDFMLDATDGTIANMKYYECPAIDLSIISNGLILTAAQSGGTYQWVDCNNGNAPISGATSQTFTPTIGGDYACQITIGSCTYLSVCENAVTGLDELEGAQFHVFPNPSTGEVHIQIPDGYNGGIRILDLPGRVVYTSEIAPEQIHLNLAPGEYILSGDVPGGLKSQRIVVL